MERSPSDVPGSASKYCMLPSEQVIGVLAASPRGSQVMTSMVPPSLYDLLAARADRRVAGVAGPGPS